MKRIKLTQGKWALVSDEDYEFLRQWKWFAFKGSSNMPYAARTVRLNSKQSYKIFMYNIVAKRIKLKEIIDHIDRNGLNNQRNNLRDSTRSQNNANRGLNKNNTSGYKGVCWNKQKQKWHARIRVNYKYVQLGLFDNIKDAARAYNKAALKYFGEFAWLNPI